jgi:hypothetical protein
MTIAVRLPASLYEQDFARWAFEQADRLRAGDLDSLDIENLAEEVESLGRDQRLRVKSRATTALTHLLKLACSPAQNPVRGWRTTVIRSRQELADLLEMSPSLAAPDVFARIHARSLSDARRLAAAELAEHQELSPPVAAEMATKSITPEQLLDPDWWP